MKFVILTAIAFLLATNSAFADFQSTCSCGERQIANFGDGSLAAEGEFPWRVSIFAGDFRSRRGETCDGSIISPSWILTSAHCIDALRSGDKISVYFNATYPIGPSWINADKHIIHPEFNEKTGKNDLALVHLSYRLRFGKNVSPICLPWNYTEDFLSHKKTVETKWTPSSLAKDRRDEVLTNQECQKYYGTLIKSGMLCTPPSNFQECQKNMGSSMDYMSPETGRSFLVGIFSSCGAGGCAESGSGPVVYTEVGKFLNWITETTQITYCTKSINEPSSTSCFVINMTNTNDLVQKVTYRILSKTPDDMASLEAGLMKEIESDSDLRSTWIQAENIYNQWRAEGRYAGETNLEMYHVALIAYTLDGFYWKFNKATYTIQNIQGADNYPYPYYMKVMVQAIQKVKGAPSRPELVAGSGTTLYRGISGRVAAVEGDLLSFQQIVSSSRSRDVADKYASQTTGCQTLFIITGPIKERLGLDDHSSGTAKANLEVLLPPTQSYRVTLIEENGLQRIIHLLAVN